MDRIRRRSSRSTVEVPILSWNWPPHAIAEHRTHIAPHNAGPWCIPCVPVANRVSYCAGGRRLCAHVSAGIARLLRSRHQALPALVDTRARTLCTGLRAPVAPPTCTRRPSCMHLSRTTCRTRAGGEAPPMRRCRGGYATMEYES
ncbi:hypothetical protein F511_35629 [Dorcoceras hygrometricum]|uniref:Uncharacterized protein n=1 Tax=Dorcoceras hygrometricum TaxID=472368 RepID=A0A2Z7CK90_9LAMI|nr:hypothetical protein F511_35629 [Dorcoceras hygrometricum]